MPCNFHTLNLQHETSTSSYVWFCCDCGEGPLNYSIQRQCHCGHSICRRESCTSEPSSNREVDSDKKCWPPSAGNRLEKGPNSDDDPLRLSGEILRQKSTECPRKGTQDLMKKLRSPPPYNAINQVDLCESPATSVSSYGTDPECSIRFSIPGSASNDEEPQIYVAAGAENLVRETIDCTYTEGSGSYTCAAESVSHPSSLSVCFNAGDGSTPTGKHSGGKTCGKRSGFDKEDDVEKDHSDDERERKRPNRGGSQTRRGQHPSRLIACPFFKRHPKKYGQSCRDKGFRTVARMKEHLYRSHRMHVCARCFVSFCTKKKLDAHSRQYVNGCKIRERPDHSTEEGIDEDKEHQLRNREGLSSLDECGKFVRVYQILFADAEVVPSPYSDVEVHLESGHTEDSPTPEPLLAELDLSVSLQDPQILVQDAAFPSFEMPALDGSFPEDPQILLRDAPLSSFDMPAFDGPYPEDPQILMQDASMPSLETTAFGGPFAGFIRQNDGNLYEDSTMFPVPPSLSPFSQAHYDQLPGGEPVPDLGGSRRMRYEIQKNGLDDIGPAFLDTGILFDNEVMLDDLEADPSGFNL